MSRSTFRRRAVRPHPTRVRLSRGVVARRRIRRERGSARDAARRCEPAAREFPPAFPTVEGKTPIRRVLALDFKQIRNYHSRNVLSYPVSSGKIRGGAIYVLQ